MVLVLKCVRWLGCTVPVFAVSRSRIVVPSHIRLIIFVTFTIIELNGNPFGGSQTGSCDTEYGQGPSQAKVLTEDVPPSGSHSYV